MEDIEEVEKAILLEQFIEIEFPNSKVSVKEYLRRGEDWDGYVLKIFDRTGLKAKTFRAKVDVVKGIEQKLFRLIRNNKRARELAYELLNA